MNFEKFQSPAKTTPHPQAKKESKFSRALSRENFSDRKKIKNRSNSYSRQKTNTLRSQKSVTRSPVKKPKFSRGQSMQKPSTNQKPKFAPKAGFAQCSICSRNFAPDRISKHKEICAKSSRTRRKVFDVSASRVEGTDAAEFQGVEVEAKNVGSDWRKKREEFVATLRAARRDARMIKKGVKFQKSLAKLQ